MHMKKILRVTALLCALIFCSGSELAAKPYPEQSATGPNAPMPSHYDLQQAAVWTEELRHADTAKRAWIIDQMVQELRGMYDGNYHPPVWMGVSSITGCRSLVPGLIQ